MTAVSYISSLISFVVGGFTGIVALEKVIDEKTSKRRKVLNLSILANATIQNIELFLFLNRGLAATPAIFTMNCVGIVLQRLDESVKKEDEKQQKKKEEEEKKQEEKQPKYKTLK